MLLTCFVKVMNKNKTPRSGICFGFIGSSRGSPKVIPFLPTSPKLLLCVDIIPDYTQFTYLPLELSSADGHNIVKLCVVYVLKSTEKD